MLFKAEKVVASLPAVLTPDTLYCVRSGSGFDLFLSDSTGSIAHKINAPLTTPSICFPLGGQFLLDPNEYNGWGTIGIYDNSNTQDLGNVGANVSRIAGGLCFPYDVRIKRLFVWHYNTNGSAEAWGWRIVRQLKVAGSAEGTHVDLLAEVADNGGVGPRNYLDTLNQLTDVSMDGLVPQGEVVVLGVEAPTAVGTNYYVRIISGFIEFERV